MNGSVLEAAHTYLRDQLMPKALELTDDFMVVVGGSVSYGLADGHSDMDLFLIWDLPRGIWFPALRSILFMHQAIAGQRLQCVPLSINEGKYEPIGRLFRGEVVQMDDPHLLYDILHYIPLYDPKGLADHWKAFVEGLGDEEWRQMSLRHASAHIDCLEAFYSGLKREDQATCAMLYGPSIQGLLELAYLANRTGYPGAKWLVKGLELRHPLVFAQIAPYLSWPLGLQRMGDQIQGLTRVVGEYLMQGDMVPA